MADSATPNLTQRSDGVPIVAATNPAHAWFSEARLGMFVHYGLYSLLGRGEWVMFNEGISAAEYNPLADRFTADDFDADTLVQTAKQAGAGYVVLVAKHHDGFCLWDSQATPFNSMRTAARRDLVREYTGACRRAGLRVGLYLSIMSWQWPAINNGPAHDPDGWRAMVDETHAQLRELLTHYGQIDLLWYDGCVVPGVSDPATVARHWCARELNAMARKLQPGIIINDRSCMPEDYSTPEQHLTLPPAGRRWEMCMTLGESWAWRPGDDKLKTPQSLINQLVFCARHDGNLLINISPEPSGKIPPAQTAVLAEVGRWMSLNGRAVRDTRRTPYTEAGHESGLCTAYAKQLFFHNDVFAGKIKIAGVTGKIIRAYVLATSAPLAFEQTDDGLVVLDFPAGQPRHATVITLEFENAPPLAAPPQKLVAKDTGLYAPAEARVHDNPRAAAGSTHALALPVTVLGRYDIELCVLTAKAARLTLRIDGVDGSRSLETACGNYPNTLAVRAIALTFGTSACTLASDDGAPFTLLSWRLQPLWKNMKAACWSMCGPFPSPYRIPGKESEVLEAMRTIYAPEKNPSQTTWQPLPPDGETIDFTKYGPADANGVYFARAVVRVPDARECEFLLGCDWWANLFINGAQVSSERAPEAQARDGSWFSGWKPIQARAPLRAGDNEILVKCHQGRAGNWFTFFIRKADGLEVIKPHAK